MGAFPPEVMILLTPPGLVATLLRRLQRNRQGARIDIIVERKQGVHKELKNNQYVY